MDKRHSTKGDKKLILSAKRKKRRLNDGLVNWQKKRKYSEIEFLENSAPSQINTNDVNQEGIQISCSPERKSRKRKRVINNGLLNWRINKNRGKKPLSDVSNLQICSAINNTSIFNFKENVEPTEILNLPHLQINKHKIVGKENFGITLHTENVAYETSLKDKFDLQPGNDTTDLVENIPNPVCDPVLKLITGKFIVDGQHFLKSIRSLESHRWMCLKNSHGYFELIKSTSKNMVWFLKFRCPFCNEQRLITSEPTNNKVQTKKQLNTAESAVWGTMAIGSGHNHLEELMSSMDIQPITKTSFLNIEERLGKIWKELLFHSMLEAGKEEKKLAIDNGDITEDGTPFITVIVDGGWSHRSHGHRYSANSGVACVIGLRTKKLLHLDVRNKYCSKCEYRKQNDLPIEHSNCYKNWDGPSSSMEADMLVEAFKQSNVIHGLEYRTMIGDGDSSVYKKITELVSYGRHVTKRECANHAVKCFTSNLFKAQKSDAAVRKVLTNSIIMKIKNVARKIIAQNFREGRSAEHLKVCLKNAPTHVLNLHPGCNDYSCTIEDHLAPILLDKLKALQSVEQCLKPLLRKSTQLVTNNTSNLAENFMSLVAKFCGGKQINRGKRGSYSFRAYGAGLDYQLGPSWHPIARKRMTGKIPKLIKLTAERRDKRLEWTQTSKLQSLFVRNKSRIKRIAQNHKGAKDYGPACQKADMDKDLYETECANFLNKLSVTLEAKERIEEKTRDQAANQNWFDERKYRLTASNFGEICRRRPSSKWAPIVKRLLYSEPFSNEAVDYGRLHEAFAIKDYCDKKNVQVLQCGLFVDIENGFLGATPDGILVGENGIIEVKCPKSAENMKIDVAIETLKQFCIDKKKRKLKHTHKYYYQIQGQLHITKKDFCDFIVWTKKDIYIERIRRDDEFWKTEMEQKLINFYKIILLPEIIDPRVARSMAIRELTK